MAWRRRVPAAPEIEWTRPIQELEPVEQGALAVADSSLPPPPPAPDPMTAPVRRRPRVDLQRVALVACAVVASLALVAIAFMQRDLRAASRRQNCFYEAQLRAFSDVSASTDSPDVEGALADCGVHLPDSDDGS